jgi:hypothetical protein
MPIDIIKPFLEILDNSRQNPDGPLLVPLGREFPAVAADRKSLNGE